MPWYHIKHSGNTFRYESSTKHRLDHCLTRFLGFLYEDIKALVRNAILNAHRKIDFNEDLHHAIFLTRSEFDLSMANMQTIMSDAIGELNGR